MWCWILWGIFFIFIILYLFKGFVYWYTSLLHCRVLEIGPGPKFLVGDEEPIDGILELIPSLKGLQVLGLINCTITNTRNKSLKQINSPLRICLWQCHSSLTNFVKENVNQYIIYVITPCSQLSSVFHMPLSAGANTRVKKCGQRL